MPDTHDRPSPGGAEQALIQALRELPLQRPGRDEWPRIAEAMNSRGRRRPSRRRTHVLWPLAAAALLVLALTMPWSIPPQPSTTASNEPPPSEDASETTVLSEGVDHLIAESQWLERLVASEALEPVAQDSDQLLLEQGLRERIRRIDTALAGSTDRPQAALWQARVGTLAQLAEVRWAGRQAAWASDGSVASPTAKPAVMWSN